MSPELLHILFAWLAFSVAVGAGLALQRADAQRPVFEGVALAVALAGAVEGGAGLALWARYPHLLGFSEDVAPSAASGDQTWTEVTGPDGSPLDVPSGWAPFPDDAAGLRVAVLGDSFAASQVPESIGHWLEVGLEVPAIVRNHGVHSLDLKTEIVMAHDLELLDPPDVLVWVWILNDLAGVEAIGSSDHINDVVGIRARDRWSHAVRLVVHASRRRQAHAQTERAYRTAWSDADNGSALQRVERDLGAAVADLQRAGTRVVVVVFPLLHALHDFPFTTEHARMIALAEDAGAEAVDLLPAFAGRATAPLWATPFDHHPNAEGNRLAAERILSHLGPRPQRAGAARCVQGTPTGVPERDAWLATRCDDDARCEAAADLAERYLTGLPDPSGWWGGRITTAALLARVPECFPTGRPAP